MELSQKCQIVADNVDNAFTQKWGKVERSMHFTKTRQMALTFIFFH
jgi:hypothetical protein